MEQTTIDGYKDIFTRHIKESRIAKMKVTEFSPQEARHFMESIDPDLSHQTHLRIKAFLSGVFSWAISTGAYRQLNPFYKVKAGGRTKGERSYQGMSVGEKLRLQKIAASHEHAYTLEEVATMMEKLPEPARTVCTVAAFTGLSRSELRGLQWRDYDEKSGTIQVQRKVVDDIVGAPKTEARERMLHVTPMVRKILTAYKKDFPPVGEGWVFRGKKGGPLSLDNLSRRDIPVHINGAWYGWHSFRRGLGTRLNEAGVDDKTIQSILRHADISTTMAYYVQPDRTAAKHGLQKLTDVLRRKYKVKV